MESPITIRENGINQKVPTKEVIENMKIGDYFMLDKSWIKITISHVLMLKEIL